MFLKIHKLATTCLTESLALPWEYRPTSKWPTMNFFCLNKQMVPKDHPVKFFSIFFRGKGGIFALKVWEFWGKITKWRYLCPRPGIEPWPPAWEAGVLSDTPRTSCYTQRQSLCIINTWKNITMKYYFSRVLVLALFFKPLNNHPIPDSWRLAEQNSSASVKSSQFCNKTETIWH